MLNKEIPFELSDYVLRKYFYVTGKNQGWLNENSAALAVSGGGDSVALMMLFKNFFDGKIFVIHINHGIRGSEADGDENFVRELSASWDLFFVSKKIDVPSLKLKGESLESAARRLRRDTICGIINENFPGTPVFLGHNRDDLAETVLFNILRGTGIRGSVGITESTDYNGVKFYRPLLGLRREFLREILRVRNISWREDSSNGEAIYTRNFIRLELLPAIEKKINSSAVEHLADFGDDMRKIREHEDEQSRALLKSCEESEPPDLILTRRKLQNMNGSERNLIIREAGRLLGLKTLSRKRCGELADLISKPSNFIFQWQDGAVITGRNGKIIFCK